MNYFFVFYFSVYSILLPLLTAAWRRDRLCRDLMPLIVLLGLGTVNEGISMFLVHSELTNQLNGNLYVLFEFILIGWLFRSFRPMGDRRFLYILVLAAMLVWVLDNLILHSPFQNNSLYRMIASFFVVCISIDRLNLLLFFNEPSPLKIPDILVCAGFVIYHAYKMFIESFHVFPIHMHTVFYKKLWLILCLINILMHTIFSIAILWIPKKQTSIILS